MKSHSNEYISIKEFAKLTGVSTQAVYKQIPTKLATYSTKIGNRWMIDKSAIETVYHNDEVQTNCNQVANDKQPVATPDITLEYIETLKNELNEKNEIIRKFQEETTELRKLLEHEQELRLKQMNQLEQNTIALQQPKRKWWQKKETV